MAKISKSYIDELKDLEQTDSNFCEDDGDEVEYTDDLGHANLLDNIRKTTGALTVDKEWRSEPTKEISEFHNSTRQDIDKVNLEDLIGDVERSVTAQKSISSHLKTVKKASHVPLPKHLEHKAERVKAYHSAKDDVFKWESVIIANSRADHLSFPLDDRQITVTNPTEITRTFQARTPLEMEVAKLLHGDDTNVVMDDRILTKAEERAQLAMDLNEVRSKRDELRRSKAFMSYQEQKSRWQNKIKSKNYRRHKRIDSKKHLEKEMERLKTEDPEGFEHKMQKMERDRIQERATLRHSNHSSKRHREKLYNKYDDEYRQQIQEKLQKKQELLKKAPKEDSESDGDGGTESEESGDEMEYSEDEGTNPWIQNAPSVELRTRFQRPQDLVNQIAKSTHETNEEDIVQSDNEGIIEPSENVRRTVEIRKKQMKHAVGIQDSESEGEHFSDDSEVEENQPKKRVRNEEKSLAKKEEKSVRNRTQKDETLPEKLVMKPSPLKKKTTNAKKKGKQATIDDEDVKQETEEKSPKKKKVKAEKSEKKGMKLKKTQKQDTDNKNRKKDSASGQSDDMPRKLSNETVKQLSVDSIFDNAAKATKEKSLKRKQELRQKRKEKTLSKVEKIFEQRKNNQYELKKPHRPLEDLSDSESSSDEDEGIIQSTTRKQTLADMDGEWSDHEDDGRKVKKRKVKETTHGIAQKLAVGDDGPVEERTLESAVLPTVVDGDSDVEVVDDNQQRLTISEAFASDDVLAEFEQEKQSIIDKDRVRDVSLDMPGWGSWGGESIKPRAPRRIIKAPDMRTRKDANLRKVIIDKNVDNTISKYQVNRVPFPFKTTEGFEKSIRAPVGRTWNTENAFRQLTKPKVVTKRGAYIKPMSQESVLMPNKKTVGI